ncbi:hypothetical protein CcaverHIS002_0208360 [Cutaneotrichosporon cavernicola]|uniref:Rhodanese domain-containing protein n=1 Tax=Cutaneotrichosporon cavernicola TaxID=279322 RepID=A0AA48I9C1_9TREE|nr:uncharacterized protein CcaverHIS019_0208370 [Cutaneotrichosporon cavernicola]BEI81676.1 hypothetical protein CcaverHIS002_0208360 [Cutaneotrichosporon cavernicola]BEI89475.1 hypothetical protein CcaverHIS019_0208370 [Cutaneotrichosporon cavernicola]BEI97248.1 hypothetical protein CcaverHIS631_0208370 [Cutaneotrichosporon cavernicola]
MSLTPVFRYINAEEMAAIIKASPDGVGKDWAVVDVRDDDFVGGNIVGALNYPSDTLLAKLDELVKLMEGVPKVVFHCALSQVRGPKAARRYAEARSLLLKDAPAQDILVLREGFSGFQSRYRNDKQLVEKFNKYYHD